jgi:hypothetical protein
LTGTKDATFDNTTGFNNSVFSIVYDATNNQIAVGGAFTTWKGVSNTYLAKLSNTGTAISSSRSNSTVYNMVSYGNWIYVLGIMGSLGGTTCSQFGKVSLSTLDSDPNFDNNGAQPVSTGIVNGGSIGVTSDGSKIYVPSGDFGATSQNRGLTAYNTSDGSMDQTYHRLGVQKMTINSSPGTIPAGTPYVIEDLRFMISRLSNSTGIYMIKGVSMLDFIPATTSFVTPVHQLSFSSGAYYLIDTGSTTLATQIGFAPGIVVDTYVNENNQWIYAQNSTGRIAGFNIRKQLKCYATSRVRYGSLPTPTDYLLTNNPSIAGITAYHKAALCTTNTGTSAGVKSIFFTATSTMYQIPFSTIGHSLSFTSNSMAEIPPGSTTTYAATATMHRVHYLPEIDRFVILNGSTSGQKSYITSFKNNLITPTLSGTTWDRDSYNTLVNQNSFERAFLSWNRLLQNSSAAVGAPKYPDTGGTTYIFSADTVDGILHMVRPVNSSENIMYSIPVGADEQYVSTSNNVLITPKYEIPNLISITGLYFNVLREYGSSVYSIPPEPILIDYRTSGIDDNSGAWTKYEDIDSLNSALCNKTTNNVTIQFRFKFRVAGNTCVPNKLYGFVISYEDDRTDSHYSPSVAESSLASRIFAWQQQSSWGGTIPNLKIRIYNASNGDLLLYDTVSESSSGTWQYSTDGITWLAWSSSADAVGNYIRYTADYVPNGFKLRVGLNTV